MGLSDNVRNTDIYTVKIYNKEKEMPFLKKKQFVKKYVCVNRLNVCMWV